MKKNITLITLLIGLVSPILVNALDNSDDILEELSDDLKTYSELATNIKQNVDYMPYIISTLDADELLSLGVLNLREALNLIPGVDLSVGISGQLTPVFRGINAYTFGQSKLIIDGVSVNDQLLGSYTQFLDIPIQLIHRIEVIRGSGSLLNDDNGYAGSINIITKANRDDKSNVINQIFTAAGSDDYTLLGGIYSYHNENIQINSDAFFQKHNLELYAGVDKFGESGYTDHHLKNYQAGLTVNYNDFKLISRFYNNQTGVNYSQSFTVSEDESDFYHIDNNYVALLYKNLIFPGIELDFSLNYYDENRVVQNKVIPDGKNKLPNGRYFITDFKEKTYTQRLEFKLTELERSKISFGILSKQSRVDRNMSGKSQDNLQTFEYKEILEIDKINGYSIYLDNLFNYSEALSLQLGLKYHSYDGMESQLTPRFATVYRYKDDNIFKLIYSHAFRQPSWREQYVQNQSFYRSNPDLEVETVDSFEFSYIKKWEIDNYFKFNAFQINNHEQIHAQNEQHTFLNSDDNHLYGAEV
ncbi:MAG: TonB-dependent receptor plug domain-containing protein, partial [Gammaproteobacteria bacterium]|nr:TonB-dependent receptor plug domain-containing protein [Gammaproteobacteria bacterium]